jgi:formylglycine-generating enzyme required for sulfatase activity
MSSPAIAVPALDATVELAAGTYRLGEPGAERDVTLTAVRIGRWPVVNAALARFVHATGRDVASACAGKLADPLLADHPATDVTYADAAAFCAWAAGRLPTGDEWEAAARGEDGRAWPWGEVFDPERCACVESGWGWTAPVTAHPAGASPCGAEQLAGNVWEWVSDATEDGAWRAVRGGSYLDHAWGVRAARVLAGDPARATRTTGFRLAIDPGSRP